jgi:hypothetical protein
LKQFGPLPIRGWVSPLDPDDPHVRAHARLVAGCVGLILLLGTTLVGVGLAVDEDHAALVRIAGAVLSGASVAALILLLRWAGRWRWRYDTGRDGLSGSEVFLTCFVAAVAFGLLYEPLDVWALLVFPLVTIGLVYAHLRRSRTSVR